MVRLDDSLRMAQILLHVMTLCGGLMTAIGLGWTVNIFSEHCVLYTDMVLLQGRNKTIRIDYKKTKWGELETCYYCMFSSVIAAIYAIIWFWFYLLLSDWNSSGTDMNLRERFTFHRVKCEETLDKRPPPDLKLFIPKLIINLVLFVCTSVNLGLVTRGGQQWCGSVSHSLGKHYQCSYLRKADWSIQHGYLVYTNLQIATVGSWVLLLSFLGKIAIVGSRLHLHFSNKSDSDKHKSNNNKKNTVINASPELVLSHTNSSSPQSSESSGSNIDLYTADVSIHELCSKCHGDKDDVDGEKHKKSNGETFEMLTVKVHAQSNKF